VTPRQKKLLQAIIDEFIETADAVGSINLANKYKLGVSPATIRNEMAELVDQGFLEQPHLSSGRIPTNMGFRFLINELINHLDELEVENSLQIYEDMFQTRFDNDELIYHAVKTLADLSNNLALVVLGKRVYYSGLSNLIIQPEFLERSDLKKIMMMLENSTELRTLFAKSHSANNIKILVGEDCDLSYMKRAAIIFSEFHSHGDKIGYLSIVGPNRMNYHEILPVFNFIGKSLNQVISGW